MDEGLRKQFVPGARVVVTQQIAMRKTAWTNETRGTIVDYQQHPPEAGSPIPKATSSGSTASSSARKTAKSPPSTSTNTAASKFSAKTPPPPAQPMSPKPAPKPHIILSATRRTRPQIPHSMHAAIFGLIVADLIAEPMDLRHPPAPGGLHLLNSITLTTGGNVCNTGLAMAKLGMNVAAAGLVGKDVLGAAVLDRLQLQPASTPPAVFEPPDAQTSATVVAVEPGGERCFFHTPGVTPLLDADAFRRCFPIFQKCQCVQVGYFGLLPTLTPAPPHRPRRASRRSPPNARSPSTPSIRRAIRDLLWPILPHLDIFAPSRTEAAVPHRRNRPRRKWSPSSAGTCPRASSASSSTPKAATSTTAPGRHRPRLPRSSRRHHRRRRHLVRRPAHRPNPQNALGEGRAISPTAPPPTAAPPSAPAPASAISMQRLPPFPEGGR